MNKALSSYRKNQISGMSRKDLIVLLYSGTANFLRQAQKFLREEKSADFSDSIERANQIVYHLYSTLDFDKGGEVAERLGALYAYIIGQLYIVNSTKNERIISDLLIIINDLKDGWQSINTENHGKSRSRGRVMPAGKQTVVSAKV